MQSMISNATIRIVKNGFIFESGVSYFGSKLDYSPIVYVFHTKEELADFIKTNWIDSPSDVKTEAPSSQHEIILKT